MTTMQMAERGLQGGRRRDLRRPRLQDGIALGMPSVENTTARCFRRNRGVIHENADGEGGQSPNVMS